MFVSTTVRVVLEPADTLGGWNDGVAPLGSPVTEKLTEPWTEPIAGRR